MNGLVSLVGAGPGDPGLLTLKAQKRLREADLIIYDYLCNPDHLRHAKAGAKIIGAGKGFRHKAISQDRINRLILKAARRGDHVVRLKGGDPYLFGRGGEEALYVSSRGVSFEVIPGVTSATACAAYAGIPLTHRDHNAAVTFLTGHRADDENLNSIPWKKVAEIGGTLVIYMGFYNLKKITRRLIQAGMSGRTPVSVIEWGTLPRQKSVASSLEGIAEAVRRQHLSAPCMIVIGDVVSLKDRLGWFEKLPLFGKKVMITRTRERAGDFREKLEALGAEVIEFPLIEIGPARDRRPLDRSLRVLNQYSWVIFSSVYGVRYFFERLYGMGQDARRLSGVRVAAVGPQTQKELLERGVRADFVPVSFDRASLAKAFLRQGLIQRGEKILLPRTDIARDDLEEILRKTGAVVEVVPAYHTACPTVIPKDLKRRVASGEADFIAFTSASTVSHFIRIFGSARARFIGHKSKILSIGPATSKTLKSGGFSSFRQARVHTVDGLIELLRNQK